MADDRWNDDERRRWDRDRERYVREGSADYRAGDYREDRGSRDYPSQDYTRRDEGRGDEGRWRGAGRDEYGREYGRDRWRGEYGRDYGRGRDFGGREYSEDSYRGYGNDYWRERPEQRGRDFGAGRYGSGRYGSERGSERYGSPDFGTQGSGRSGPDRYGSEHYGSPDYGTQGSGRFGPDRGYGSRGNYGSQSYGSAYESHGRGAVDEPSSHPDPDYGFAVDTEYRGSRPYGVLRNYGGAGEWRGPWNEERGWWDRTRDEVRSWMGDEDADRRRRMDSMQQAGQDPNLRRGHAGRGPKGYTRTDARILEDVNDRLTDDWRVDASEIEVNVSNGEVTLSGAVDSRETRRRAEDIAASVSGVKDVQNSLRVRQSWQTGNLTGGSSQALEQTTGLTSGTPRESTQSKH